MSLCSDVTGRPIELRCILCQEPQIPPQGFATAIESVLQAGQDDGQRHGQWDAGVVEDATLCRPEASDLIEVVRAALDRLQLPWQEQGGRGYRDKAGGVKDHHIWLDDADLWGFRA